MVSRLSPADRESFKELVPIIDVASGSNPRSVVRFVNNLLVDRAIFAATAGEDALKEMAVHFFAVSRSLQQRWPAMFAMLARSDELCVTVAGWLKEEIPAGQKGLAPDLKGAAELLRTDPDLKQLLRTDYGVKWLTQNEMRSTTIDFLQIWLSTLL